MHKIFLAAFVFMGLISTISASEYFYTPSEQDAYFVDPNSCPCPQYDFCEPACCPRQACCGPLWTIKIKGGVVPTFYTESKQAWLNIPTAGRLIQASGKKAKFLNQFELPWTAGGEIGFFVTPSTELFIDGDYTRAKGKNFHFVAISGTLGTRDITQKFTDFEQASAYVGLRQYFRNFFCSNADLYFGVKAGYQHRQKIDETTTIAGIGTFSKNSHFQAVNTVGGGAQLGLNFTFCHCWQLNIQVEALYSGPMRPAVVNLDPTLTGGLASIVAGETGALISVPCTIGLSAAW